MLLAPIAGLALVGSAAPAPTALESALESAADSSGFAGTVLIADQEKIIHRQSFGYANVEFHIPFHHHTRFKAFSTSKQITAMAAMVLAEQGELDFQSPAASHFESWPDAWQGVTVEHLIQHTSGIPDLLNEWASAWQPDELAAMNAFLGKDQPELATKPGEKWSYSNFGYCLLANVVAKASGKPFEDFVDRKIFKTAGMRNAVYETPARDAAGNAVGGEAIMHLATPYHGSPDSVTVRGGISYVMAGAGGVICSANDLVSYGQAVLTGKLVSKEAAERMWQNTAETGGAPYGYGWVVREIEKTKVPSHSGGNNGYVSELSIVPSKGLTIVVMSNRAYASPRAMSDAALASILGE